MGLHAYGVLQQGEHPSCSNVSDQQSVYTSRYCKDCLVDFGWLGVYALEKPDPSGHKSLKYSLAFPGSQER